MPGLVLTVALRAEMLEILAMVRRSSSPLLELAARRLEDAIEHRGPRWPLPVQLALWAPESMQASPPESSGDAAPPAGIDDRGATALRAPGPEQTRAGGAVPEVP
jgi:hypothetical protein